MKGSIILAVLSVLVLQAGEYVCRGYLPTSLLSYNLVTLDEVVWTTLCKSHEQTTIGVVFEQTRFVVKRC